MFDIDTVLKIIRHENKRFIEPIVTTISRKRTPFHVLISCLLSLRTKDQTTSEASRRLFAVADNPEEMMKIPIPKLEKLIYPVGFYRTKARKIKEICKILIGEYHSGVPDEIDELLKLNGVGRKTANLVVTLGYKNPASVWIPTFIGLPIVWDMSKRRTLTRPNLRSVRNSPKKYWLTINDLLVTYGQNICVPISPNAAYVRFVYIAKRRE